MADQRVTPSIDNSIRESGARQRHSHPGPPDRRASAGTSGISSASSRQATP
jgi:hypothetical protein